MNQLESAAEQLSQEMQDEAIRLGRRDAELLLHPDTAQPLEADRRFEARARQGHISIGQVAREEREHNASEVERLEGIVQLAENARAVDVPPDFDGARRPFPVESALIAGLCVIEVEALRHPIEIALDLPENSLFGLGMAVTLAAGAAGLAHVSAVAGHRSVSQPTDPRGRTRDRLLSAFAKVGLLMITSVAFGARVISTEDPWSTDALSIAFFAGFQLVFAVIALVLASQGVRRHQDHLAEQRRLFVEDCKNQIRTLRSLLESSEERRRSAEAIIDEGRATAGLLHRSTLVDNIADLEFADRWRHRRHGAEAELARGIDDAPPGVNGDGPDDDAPTSPEPPSGPSLLDDIINPSS